MCVCINSAGDRCMHALIYRSTQDTRQLCSVWEPGRRICPAFPSSRQPSFDSLTFQFCPPALSSWISPLPFLPSSLSLSPSTFSPPVSLPRPLIFCLSWRAIPEPSIIAFCYLAKDGIEFDAPTRSLRDFLCTPIRSACRPVAGRSSTLQRGAPNLSQCLSAAPSLHLFLSVFHASFCPPFSLPVFLYLSLSLWHQLHLFLSCSLSFTYTISSLSFLSTPLL